jgi:transglutaminase-like putative cysteine protease
MEMMVTVLFDIRCELDYEVLGQSEFLFNVHATENSQQRVSHEAFSLDGVRYHTEHVDPDLGNRFVRASADPGEVKLRYETRLRVEHVEAAPAEVRERDVAELPVEVLRYVLPSRYCQSDRMMNLALREFGSLPRGWTRVEAVCDWVHQYMRFQPGTTNVNTSAVEVLVQGSGVCRDFSHLTIALLRALNIPARFVTGYDYGVDPVYGPTDFHAYVEAYLEDRWWIFDATRLAPRNGLVRIGTGRDAADCAFATIFGATHFRGMRLDIQPVGARILDDRTRALSTARLDVVMSWRPRRPHSGSELAAA